MRDPHKPSRSPLLFVLVELAGYAGELTDDGVLQRTGRQSGLAFVHFASTKEGMHAAFRAVSGIDGNTVDGISFRAELSRNLLRQFDHEAHHGRNGGEGFPTDMPGPQQAMHFSSAYSSNPTMAGMPAHPASMAAQQSMRIPQPPSMAPQQSYPMQGYLPRDVVPMEGHHPSRPAPFGYEQGLPGRSYSTPAPHSSLSHHFPQMAQQALPAKAYSVQFPLPSYPANDSRRLSFGLETPDLITSLMVKPPMEPLPPAVPSSLAYPLSSAGNDELLLSANSPVPRTVRASFTSVASDPSVSTVTSHSPTFDRNPTSFMPAPNANFDMQAHAKLKNAAVDSLLRTASDDSASTFEESPPFSAASHSWTQDDALDQLNQRAVVWNLNVPGTAAPNLATKSTDATCSLGGYTQF